MLSGRMNHQNESTQHGAPLKRCRSGFAARNCASLDRERKTGATSLRALGRIRTGVHGFAGRYLCLSVTSACSVTLKTWGQEPPQKPPPRSDSSR